MLTFDPGLQFGHQVVDGGAAGESSCGPLLLLKLEGFGVLLALREERLIGDDPLGGEDRFGL